MTAYQDGAWGSSLEINSIADTDGHPGAEIVLIIQEPTTAGVGIIQPNKRGECLPIY